MPIKDTQNFGQMGARVFFKEDRAAGSPPAPWVDLGVGTLEPAAPETETVELEDTSSGTAVVVATGSSKRTESYTYRCNNMSAYNFGIFYSGSVESLTQATTPVVDRKHYAWPDQLAPLLDAAYDAGGQRVMRVDTSGFTVKLDSSGSPGAAISAGNIVLDADRGFFTCKAAGLAAAGVVWVSFTPLAITGYRKLRAQTREQDRTGEFEIWFGQDSNTTMMRRSFKGTIRGTNLSPTVTEFSNLTFDITVTSDVNDTNLPAGDFRIPKGTLPTPVGPLA